MSVQRAVAAIAVAVVAAAATLHPETSSAFDKYIRFTESLMQRTPNYLWVDAHPEDKARVRSGEMVVVSERTASGLAEMKISGGEIHDWTGMVFIPNSSIAAARAVMQDYANYKNIYRPEVVESKLLSRKGDEFHVFLRLYAKQLITVVYNTEYDIVYGQPDPQQMWIRSRSTRIAELDDPSANKENPVGEDNGFLWRINAYWRFEEGGGGLYAQCRAISLSRGLPMGFGWLRGFIQQFPKQSMSNTLAATKRALAGRT